MLNPYDRRTFTSALSYRDPKAAIDWLERAFGFKRVMVITDESGAVAHAELSFGDGQVMLGGEWSEHHKSPASLDSRNSQSVHVHLTEDIDAHCARAAAAGAEILMQPADQFYGDRTYRARDLEGHVWVFGQTIKAISREDAERASGLKIDGWPS